MHRRAPIRISLLGDMRVERDGRQVPLPASKKTRALFAYLLLSDRPRRREALCELFWEIPDDPRASLRWSLSKIRKILEPDGHWLKADRERVQLDVPPGVVDLHDLAREDVDPAHLAEAALDAPLAGLDLPRLGDYAMWLAAERAIADRNRARVLRSAALDPGAAPEKARLYRETAEAIDPGGAVPKPRALAASQHYRDIEQTVQYCLTPDAVSIAYAVTGTGPPLVKAANWLGHLDLDWDSLTWGRMFHELSEGHSLVRYDERGNGLSDWSVADLSFDAFVADLEVVVDHVGLERFPLIGISQGAAVSIEYAYRHPERVDRLALIGGYAMGWRHYADDAMREEREAVMALVRHGWGENNPAYRQIFSHSFFPAATPEEIDWFNEFQRRTTSAANAVRFLEVFATIDVRHRLASLAVPTLVIHSRDDARVSVKHGKRLAAEIPGATLVTLDSASHTPLGREPAYEVMMARIRAFLAAG
jgi:pimeloyl-ACP methyl ester carboxylesterase